MTVVEWDKVGDRIYETGVDRGMLYIPNGASVPWNGLTGVEEGSNAELKSFYLDGVKVLDRVAPGDFVGKLNAFTYPEEFEECVGVTSDLSGLSFYDQPSKKFNLSYRTLIGNDLDGSDHGYKIHLFYNLTAMPEAHSFESIQNPATPTQFSWSLSGTPPLISDARPTSHIAISTLDTDPSVITAIENILYGTPSSNPRFPTVGEIRSIFGTYGILFIIDNGDGTWTASDVAGTYISMDSPTQFTIRNADANYLDASTYQIRDTYPD